MRGNARRIIRRARNSKPKQKRGIETIGSVKPAGLQGVDENVSIIVYCRTGVRSEHASNMLLNLGYKHVFDLGGIVDWNGEKVAGTEPGSFAGDAQ